MFDGKLKFRGKSKLMIAQFGRRIIRWPCDYTIAFHKLSSNEIIHDI
mgnify:CR=1 FL=1